MPIVPKYDGPQVEPGGAVPARFTAHPFHNYAAQQAQQTGQALQQFGGAIGRIAEDMQRQTNTLRVDDVTNQQIEARMQLHVEAMQLKGRDALERPDGKSLPDEYGERLRKNADELSKVLSNDAQRMAFRRNAQQIQQQMYVAMSNHMMAQQQVFQDETQKTTIATATKQAVLMWNDGEVQARSLDAIRHTIGQMAQQRGWDKDTAALALSEALSPLHAGVIKSMIQGGMAAEAQKYYEDNNASMSLQARANMQGVLAEAVNTQRAEAATDAAWLELGPKSDNDAVRTFDMEALLRKSLKGAPDVLKLAISNLRQRAQAFNAQQGEAKAQNVAGVWQLVDSGTPLSGVYLSDQWLALDGITKQTLRKQLDSGGMLMQNADNYLTFSDPDVLSKMSRAQVESLRGDFGLEATKHLLDRWDQLQRPDKLAEARMDTDDFNMVADAMGLKPFASGLSENKKRDLGMLKYRVEQLINRQQSEAKRTLTRKEKMSLMREEMARKVTVNPWYRSSKEVPVIQLTPDQSKYVVVPPAERARIVEALRARYAKDPNNPDYFPTEENVRRLYIRSISTAGELSIHGE